MKLKILGIVALAVFLIDQGTKFLIVSNLPLGASTTIIPNFFDVIHTTNRGAAFGAFSNLPDHLRIPFFFVSSALALTVVLIYFFKVSPNHRSVLVALSLILGGAFGNIYDRIFRGEVVDFLSFHWYDRVAHFELGSYTVRFSLEWPAFNVADIAITVAVIWLLLVTLKGGPPENSKDNMKTI